MVASSLEWGRGFQNTFASSAFLEGPHVLTSTGRGGAGSSRFENSDFLELQLSEVRPHFPLSRRFPVHNPLVSLIDQCSSFSFTVMR